jgi:hypothetical protein
MGGKMFIAPVVNGGYLLNNISSILQQITKIKAGLIPEGN